MKCSKCKADLIGDTTALYCPALISENEQLKERVKGLESEKRSGWVKWKESEIDEFIKEIGILREDRKNRIAIIFTLEKQLKDKNGKCGCGEKADMHLCNKCYRNGSHEIIE